MLPRAGRRSLPWPGSTTRSQIAATAGAGSSLTAAGPPPTAVPSHHPAPPQEPPSASSYRLRPPWCSAHAGRIGEQPGEHPLLLCHSRPTVQPAPRYRAATARPLLVALCSAPRRRRPLRRAAPAVRVGPLELHRGTARHLPENATPAQRWSTAFPRSGCSTGCCTTGTSASPTAEATGCVRSAAEEGAANPPPDHSDAWGLSVGQNRGPQLGRWPTGCPSRPAPDHVTARPGPQAPARAPVRHTWQLVSALD